MPHLPPAIAESRSWKLIERLRRTALVPGLTVPCTVRLARPAADTAWSARERLDWQPVTEGQPLGGPWERFWLHATASIPREWAGRRVVVRIDCGGEVLVRDADGEPRLGLTNGSVFWGDYAKDLVHLTPAAQGGEAVELWLEAVGSGLFGLNRTDPEYPHDLQHLHGRHAAALHHCHLAVLDQDLYDLLLDLEILHDLYKALHESLPRKAKLLHALDRAVSAFDRAGAAAARAELAPALAVPADPAAIRFTAVGHAHIDTAWLWPIAETRRKAARTFASQLGLIERYHGYVFGASQPALYDFVRQDHPGLFHRIQRAVQDGGWELQGAMWVEADCNIPSGESLVRQVVKGQRFYQQHFGRRVRNLWLPDVFGYSAQLPQILAKAGVPYFLTQKLSWNKVNEFPHNTFVWRGLDGSEVLAHFPPENDYNARCWPKGLVNAQARHKERGLVDEAISLFGIGDGGGGPKEEFIERALRLRDLNGVPPYRFGAAQPALERLDRHRADYATWVGELYFEMHRATYTTQAQMKRANRRAEEALDAAEKLISASAAAVPAAALDAAWKTVLTNQFHDIIPGSSIHAVYEQAVPEDEAVAHAAHGLGRTAASAAMRADAACCTWFNPSATGFHDLVALPVGWTGATYDGVALPTQRDGAMVVVALTVPAHGTIVLRRAEGMPATARRVDGLRLANARLTARFDGGARLVSLVAAHDGRELLAQPGNDLALCEDRPHCYDAWDIDEQVAQARRGGLEVAAIHREQGPLFAELVVKGVVGRSAVEQRIRLAADGERLDFRTTIDWNERHKLLRVLFPTALAADRFAGEMQYGYLDRPTHRNTAWDAAKFEVCCHRWADLGERDRGLALLNDSKYGYSAEHGLIALSLLRAPTDPDPIADLGRHAFTYALLPHAGHHSQAPVRAHAAMLNAGLVRLEGLDGTGFALPVACAGEGAELAVLKPAEDGDGLVARVVEVRGGRARVRVSAPGRALVRCDLLEDALPGAQPARDALELDLGPFAIETLRVR